MTKYHNAIQALESKKSNRKDPALKNTEKALKELGNPQEEYSVVLVGGTNGKGSTTEMISEMLSELGNDVGTFKSPHLKTLRERIKVNGRNISRNEILDQNRILEDLNIDLSFFESLTVIAYHYFSEKEIDYAIIEVGMGGNLDATNAANPELSIITNVEKDHTKYLGKTREAIAGEIAGIIPEKGKVITREKLESIETRVEKKNAKSYSPVKIDKVGSKYVFKDKEFKLPVNGSFQLENLETALKALSELERIPADIENSLSGLKCPGRMEKINQNPKIIIDGAHNPAAIEKIQEDLPEEFICVFGCTDSKAKNKMIHSLENKASKFIFTKPDVSWAENPENLQDLTKMPSEVFKDSKEALDRAKLIAEKQGIPVVITGSLYLIGNIKEKTEL